MYKKKVNTQIFEIFIHSPNYFLNRNLISKKNNQHDNQFSLLVESKVDVER